MRFVSDISLFWLFPWLVISILLSFYLYKNESWCLELKKSWQYTLKSLRALGLFLLGVLLVGLLFEAVDYRVEKPVFITMIDNSSSMKNYQDSLVVKNKITHFEQKMRAKYGTKFDFVQYIVGSNVNENGKRNFRTRGRSPGVAINRIPGAVRPQQPHAFVRAIADTFSPPRTSRTASRLNSSI